MGKYIVIDVGCLECGVTTNYEGMYATKKEAEDKVKSLSSWRNGGQADPIVFEINKKN